MIRVLAYQIINGKEETDIFMVLRKYRSVWAVKIYDCSDFTNQIKLFEFKVFDSRDIAKKFYDAYVITDAKWYSANLWPNTIGAKK